MKKGSEIKEEKFGASDSKYYLHIPKFGRVMLREKVRIDGPITGVTVSLEVDKYFASFSIKVPDGVYELTHKPKAQEGTAVGIDRGLLYLLTLSTGTKIEGNKTLRKSQRKLKKYTATFVEKCHPRTKGEKSAKSHNYIKQSKKLGKLHRIVKAKRSDQNQKLSLVLVRHFSVICLEILNVLRMMKNHRLAQAIADNSPYALKALIKMKAEMRGCTVFEADPFFPSSKTCSCCGHVHKELNLNDRIFVCPICNHAEDRDLQAAKNLLKLYEDRVGGATSELLKIKPVDLTALLADLTLNQLITSRDEAGIR